MEEIDKLDPETSEVLSAVLIALAQVFESGELKLKLRTPDGQVAEVDANFQQRYEDAGEFQNMEFN